MNISWMKLDVNILNDSKIKIIRKYPDGNSLFVLWVGLLCLAMKSDVTGYVYITQGLPYTAEDLASEFNIEKRTVEMGLELFKRMGMIDFTEGKMIEIVNFNKHQNIDKIEKHRLQTRERVKKHRLNKSNALHISYIPVTNDDVTPQIRIDKNRIDKIRKEIDILIIFNCWNKKQIQKHSLNVVTEKLHKRHFDSIESYGLIETCIAIDNYSSVLKSTDYYFKHKWSLWDFISRGLDKFVNSADPLNNFLDSEIRKKKIEEERREKIFKEVMNG